MGKLGKPVYRMAEWLWELLACVGHFLAGERNDNNANEREDELHFYEFGSCDFTITNMSPTSA